MIYLKITEPLYILYLSRLTSRYTKHTKRVSKLYSNNKTKPKPYLDVVEAFKIVPRCV